MSALMLVCKAFFLPCAKSLQMCGKPPHLTVHGKTRSADLGLQDGWPGEVTLSALGLLSNGPHMHLDASSACADQPA